MQRRQRRTRETDACKTQQISFPRRDVSLAGSLSWQLAVLSLWFAVHWQFFHWSKLECIWKWLQLSVAILRDVFALLQRWRTMNPWHPPSRSSAPVHLDTFCLSASLGGDWQHTGCMVFKCTCAVGLLDFCWLLNDPPESCQKNASVYYSLNVLNCIFLLFAYVLHYKCLLYFMDRNDCIERGWDSLYCAP